MDVNQYVERPAPDPTPIRVSFDAYPDPSGFGNIVRVTASCGEHAMMAGMHIDPRVSGGERHAAEYLTHRVLRALPPEVVSPVVGGERRPRPVRIDRTPLHGDTLHVLDAERYVTAWAARAAESIYEDLIRGMVPTPFASARPPRKKPCGLDLPEET